MTSTDVAFRNMDRQRSGGQNSQNGTNVGEVERIASAMGGGALAFYGLSRASLGGLALAALGGALAYRGVTGHCPVYQALGISTAENTRGQEGIKVEKTVTINQTPETLYRFWRNFENLPRFMKHLDSVRIQGDNNSHWVAKGPAGTHVEWDAEITEERENELIAWRSLPGAQVENAGEVRFVRAPGDRGSEVHVTLSYNPPAGAVGALVAKLFGEEPSQQVAGDLRRFKNIMEAGEIPTTEGQPSGRSEDAGKRQDALSPDHGIHKPNQLGAKTLVTKASEDSFPASDPPALDPQEGTTNEQQVGLGKRIY